MLFIYLHIFAMFIGVALSVGSELILRRIAMTENVAAIRTVFKAAQPIGRAIPMAYGIVAALGASFNLLAVWRVISAKILA